MKPRFWILGGVICSLGWPAQAVVPIRLSGCTDIRQSGSYIIDRDISGTVGAACIQIRDVADVELNCNGHSITTESSNLAALVVQTAKNFKVTGCTLPQLSGYSLYVGNSENGTITQNSMKDMIVHMPEGTAAETLRIVGNNFSEFGSVAPGAGANMDGGTGVIPMASGVNLLLARYMLVPFQAEEAPYVRPVVATPETHPSVYPNPWRADRAPRAEVTFDQLPANSTIRIFTLSAHAVKTITASGATVPWDLRNDAGEPVASGVYLYSITSEQGQKTVNKLAVIR